MRAPCCIRNTASKIWTGCCSFIAGTGNHHTGTSRGSVSRRLVNLRSEVLRRDPPLRDGRTAVPPVGMTILGSWMMWENPALAKVGFFLRQSIEAKQDGLACKWQSRISG